MRSGFRSPRSSRPTNPYYFTAHWKALRQAALERDGYRCTVAGCFAVARVVDHIKTRPPVPHPCAEDTLGNLRSLCSTHDGQVKEKSDGTRARDGRFRVIGCSPDGQSLDPNHPWKR